MSRIKSHSTTGAKLVRLKETLAAEMARKRAELRKEKSHLHDLENEEGFDMDDEAELTGKSILSKIQSYFNW